MKLAKRKADELENSVSMINNGECVTEDIKTGTNILLQIMNDWKKRIKESDMSGLEMLNIFRNLVQEKYISDIENNTWIQKFITE